MAQLLTIAGTAVAVLALRWALACSPIITLGDPIGDEGSEVDEADLAAYNEEMAKALIGGSLASLVLRRLGQVVLALVVVFAVAVGLVMLAYR